MQEKQAAANQGRTRLGLLKWLGIGWRVVGTSISFLVFGLGGLVTSLLIFPLMFLYIRHARKPSRLARRYISRAFRLFVGLMKGLGVMTYEIEGGEHVQLGNNRLIVANHPSLIDVVFLVSMFPGVDCVVKEGVVKNPFMRGVAVPANYISSNDPVALLDTCVSRLSSGASLVLFPEGTRSVVGKALKFRPGAASIAVRARSEILPVTIRCSQPRLLAKGEPWYRITPEKPVFSLKVYPPIPIDNLVSRDLPARQAGRELNARLLDFFNQELA
jgi:1-acyl-sn-glycerol-3-phosphate acyltransferase